MDSDDDLQLPPPRPAINLSDSDDDLPPPAGLAAKRPPPPPVRPATASALVSPNNKSGPAAATTALPAPSSPATLSRQKAASQQMDPRQQSVQLTSETKTRVHPAKVYKEGFLLKQQPSWPYSNQKRYCVLKNCRLYYFDSQESMKEGKPQGVIDLTNAKLTEPGNEAKLPSSFGIHVGSEKQTDGGNNGGSNKKERTFIFSVVHAHELGEWKSALQSVVGDTEEEEGVHWFEKMVQGVY